MSSAATPAAESPARISFDAFSYSDSLVPVRDDLEAAHRRVWQRTANPGTWLTGKERVAVAEETRRARDCRICSERKDALSPFSVKGRHDSDGELPAAIVDVAHRLTTDSGRLTRKWFDGLVAGGLADAAYVEVVGVVVRTVSVDMFAKAMGLTPRPLPLPVDGEPSRRRPAGAIDEGCWVPTQPNGSELYGGRTSPNVGRALSLVPEEVAGLVDLANAQYMPVVHVADPTYEPGRAIDRAQMELVAGRTSALNECFY